jgi:hypothetical protein
MRRNHPGLYPGRIRFSRVFHCGLKSTGSDSGLPGRTMDQLKSNGLLKRPHFMRLFMFSFFAAVLLECTGARAQSPVENAINPVLGVLAPRNMPAQPLIPAIASPEDSNRGFLKKLTVDSFGFGLGPYAPGFEFSPGYTAALFNLHGLECPRCVPGPRVRGKFTLPPFGAKAIMPLRENRTELFGGFGGIEAWKPDNTIELQKWRRGSSTYGDAWLTQAEFGGRTAVDRNQHIWLGATGRALEQFGSERKRWGSVNGSATFTFGH